MVSYPTWPDESGCTSCARDFEAMRAYLRAVYPAAHFDDRVRVPNKLLTRFFRSRHWYYATELSRSMSNVTQRALLGQTIVSQPGFKCLAVLFGGIRASMHTRLVRRYTADATHFPFLPCTPGPECIARQASFRSAFSGHRFFEVFHFAFKSKREPSGPHALRWAHVLDGESLWYWHAPGSGVFYDGGVVCSAPGKIHMLALLLRRWLESPSPVPSVAKSVGAALARLAAKMGEQGRGV